MLNLPHYIKHIDGEYWFVEEETDGFKFFYKVKEFIFNKSSPFQHIMVLDSYDFGKMLVLDGAVQTTVRDGFVYNEMISHLPMNIHPNPKSVLIIGGGDCGAAKELLKYREIQHVDMVEIDEMVVKTCFEYLPEISGGYADSSTDSLIGTKVNFIFRDGIKYVQEIAGSKKLYDVIIVDSSDPVGPAIPLFGLDFYKSLYNILSADGLMVCQSESPLFHSHVTKTIYKNLDSLFPIVRPYTAIVPTYPGGIWSFTLASKKYKDANPLKFDVDDKKTKYINREILDQCFSLPEFVKLSFYA